jgi:aspergillopepsin I
MFQYNSIVSSALLWSLASASPTVMSVLDQLASSQTFTLEQVAVPRSIPWSGPHEMTRMYWKYGVEPPQDLIAQVRNIDDAGPGTATAAAKPFKGDTEYLLNVKVGNHNLTLDLDTGSADLYAVISSPHVVC